MPKVLIADELSPSALDIFRRRGVEVDVKVGLKKPGAAQNHCSVRWPRGALGDQGRQRGHRCGRATQGRWTSGHRRRQHRYSCGFSARHRGDEHAIRQFNHDGRARDCAATRRCPSARCGRCIHAGRPLGEKPFHGCRALSKVLGLIGCGNIGALVAERAIGLKMKVIAYDPFLSADRAVRLGVEKVELEELLSRADAISLHTPMTERTRNILSAEAIRKTKRGVIIVNAARGGLIDESALRDALESGHVAAAGVDVFSSEPAKENPLFGAPNLVATPHPGASTNEAQENVALQLAEQMADYLLSRGHHQCPQHRVHQRRGGARLAAIRLTLAERLWNVRRPAFGDGYRCCGSGVRGRSRSLEHATLTATALAALMRPLMPDINMISAQVVLSQKGTPLTESKRDVSPIYGSLMRLRVLTGGQWLVVAGSVVAGSPEAR